MRSGNGFCLAVFAAAGLFLLPGCFGITQNPSYFPYLFSTGDIIRTHPKPPGSGFFANFDPHAVRLEVRPVESTSPVRGQHVLIATVYDENGVPRRNRRVEWMLEGVGNIIEVDASGHFPGRGQKVDNRFAISYTGYHEHVITRGNANPSDDFVIRPGQTWCVISSPVDGDSHVTVYAPGIYNWDSHKVFVTKHWVDAEWTLPLPAVNRAGTEHLLTTNVFRHTDRQPLARYRVRYRLIDGPPAGFLPGRSQEFVAESDLRGNATATLVQLSPQAGTNRIGIEVIRPPDPSSPGGVGIVIGRGETSKQWLGPQVTMTFTGPASAVVGRDIPYSITITNNGAAETPAITVRAVLPEGMEHVRSDPRAIVEGNQLIWTLAPLPGNRAHKIQFVTKSSRIGTAVLAANVNTDGFRDEKSVTTQFVSADQAKLELSLTGADTAAVGQPITYQITVTNPGSVAISDVVLASAFDRELEHASRSNPIELPLGIIEPGGVRTVPMTLVPRKVGRFSTRVTVYAGGAAKAQSVRTVNVLASLVTINKTGPRAAYMDQTVAWTITVANQGDVPAVNVVVRDLLPPELGFMSATELGQLVNGQVVWNLGTIQPRGSRQLRLTARCLRRADQVLNSAVVTADPGMQETAQATIKILGIPAFALGILKTGDPALVGGKVVYKITVSNTGSLPANQIEITAVVPKEMKVLATDGPAKGQLDGNRVVFPRVDGLQPKQSFTYTVEVQAQQPGDVRFRVELRSPALDASLPVVKEESTNVYAPLNGNGNGNGNGAPGNRPAPDANSLPTTGPSPAP